MSLIEWQLGPNDVHCWFLTLDRFPASELAAVLCPDERQRAARFVFERDRAEYTVCRGVLRRLLARYGAGPASGLRFEYSAAGKPRLPVEHNAARLEFNVAHSHGAAVIGVTRGRPLGVDVECVRPLTDLADLVRMYFAAEEQAEFWSLPEAVRTRAFFAGWTRKEAFLKATGEGLGRPLGSFALTLAPDRAARLLRVDADPTGGSGWTVVDLTRDGTTAAAVAVPVADALVHARDLVPQLLGLSDRLEGLPGG
jgi:4'-phosphopantetheinyl transferase